MYYDLDSVKMRSVEKRNKARYEHLLHFLLRV